MTKRQEIQLFEARKVCTVWDDEQEKWYFAIIDVCEVLTESKDALTARKYWNKLKQRLEEEGNETVEKNLRDNMTNIELALNILAEASTTEISRAQNPKGFQQSAEAARKDDQIGRASCRERV